MKPSIDKKSRDKSQPSNVLHFYVNQESFTIKDPDPRTLLADFLRSPEVGLTGTKKVCAQGGCGACTVMLSAYDADGKKVEHRSVNSCMRPICSLDGMQVTTTEGIGSVNTEVDPVQFKIAMNNGSQCGFCTPGWVMNMHAFLAANQGKKLTKKDIEDNFDGNICRCTGYRPILKAMKEFAIDWDPEVDGKNTMTCVADPAELPRVKSGIRTNFPNSLKKEPHSVVFEKGGFTWARPLSLEDLRPILAKGYGSDELKLTVGNTSIGIYNQFPLDEADYYYPKHYVDIDHIKALHHWKVDKNGIVVGAATTYTTFLDKLKVLSQKATKDQQAGVDTLLYMAHRTAGAIVRNAASLAGNTMLVVHHIEKGSPFPSDLFTALVGLGAKIEVFSSEWKSTKTYDLLDFALQYHQDEALSRHSVIVAYHIPFTAKDDYIRCYKVALRHENSHSIVNAAIRFPMQKGKIHKPSVVFGGIAPVAFHAKKVEETLHGKALTNRTLATALKVLKSEIKAIMAANKDRLEGLPNEGFTEEYRLQLAESYLYKHFVYVLSLVDKKSVPLDIASAGMRVPRPVTEGKQYYTSYPEEYPVNQPIIKLSAFMQATGEAKYIHDTFLPPRGLVSAWVTSASASANICYQIPGSKGPEPATAAQLRTHLSEKFEAFRDLVDWRDVPVQSEIFQGGGKDDPIFVVDKVTAQGQSIALVLATEETIAYEIAYYVSNYCINYDQEEEPIITIEEALAKGSIFEDCPDGRSGPKHIWKITRDGSKLDWAVDPMELPPKDINMTKVVIDGEDCLLVQGWQKSGAQIHFYMESQCGIVTPGEHKEVVVLPASQSPDSVQSMVKDVLGLQANNVNVKVKRLGGAYGGKTTRSSFIASPISVAAWKHKRPVKLVMRREVDTGLVGHRHPVLTNYQIAISKGDKNGNGAGQIKGLAINWWSNGGNTYDASFTVMDCLQLRSSSAYYVPNYQSMGDVCRTNLASNTAFRAFGMIQGVLGLEDGIEAAAHHLGIQAEDIREQNLYTIGQTTPFGQPLDNLYIKEVWKFTREKVNFDERLKAVQDFNKKNRWTKRGICMMPVLYGAGYNAVFLEQGGALVEVYDQDGSIVIRTGGVEMGQGINTKISQVAAESLNVPLRLINIGETDVAVVPNPISTGASTGSSLNAGAVRKACLMLKQRLEEYCLSLLTMHGAEWCREQNVNFWDYTNGWRTEIDGMTLWQHIVGKAYFDRVNLTAQARYRQPGGSGVDSSLSFHDGACTEEVNYFVGFTYNAACTEIELDVLTGEYKILQSDIIYDNGKSLNPAIDIGQIEGGFVQGLGYVLTEELVYQEKGKYRGRLNTLNTWRYKPPATSTIPFKMNVHLFPREEANVAADPNLLLGAKEVGEPPVVLAATAYFAIKRAVLSAREDAGVKGWFRMDAPATVQRIQTACKVDQKAMKL